MRKTALVFFLMLIGLSVFAQTGVIRQLSGTVELKAAGTSAYVPAKAGDELRQDTVISTGFKSTALVELGSAMITVRPLTRLTLTEIKATAGAETLNVNLQAGRVRVDVNPPAGTKTAMAVTSPIATASVRGTSFDFDTRNLHVNHGTVSFHGNRGKPMLVSGGSNSQVKEDGKTEDPIVTKGRRLRPLPPVGADTSSGAAGGSTVHTNGVFSIELDYSSSNSDSSLPTS